MSRLKLLGKIIFISIRIVSKKPKPGQIIGNIFSNSRLQTCPSIRRNGQVILQGLPYTPRVHLSKGSLVRSPLKWLWSEEPMVRRSFIPKFLCSESCYVPKIPYSERPSTIWMLCYEDSLVRSSSSPKGAMFRTSIFRKSPLPHTGSILRRSFSPKFPQF